MQRRRALESQLAALDASGIPSSTSSSSNESEDAPVPVTNITHSPQPAQAAQGRKSFGGNMGSLRNRIVSGGGGGGGRQTVKAAMGESYDLLDQNELPPLYPAPSNGQQSPRSGASRSWIPWSPSAGNSSGIGRRQDELVGWVVL